MEQRAKTEKALTDLKEQSRKTESALKEAENQRGLADRNAQEAVQQENQALARQLASDSDLIRNSNPDWTNPFVKRSVRSGYRLWLNPCLPFFALTVTDLYIPGTKLHPFDIGLAGQSSGSSCCVKPSAFNSR